MLAWARARVGSRAPIANETESVWHWRLAGLEAGTTEFGDRGGVRGDDDAWAFR